MYTNEREWLGGCKNIIYIKDFLNNIQHPYTINNLKESVQIKTIDDAIKEALSIDKDLIYDNISRYKESKLIEIDNFLSLIEKDLQDLKNKKVSIEEKYKNANFELIKKEKGIQESLSNQLIWFFVGSLLLVLLTMIGLLIAPQEKTKIIVTERTAFETISICLFLTTVLFLGTGGFIEKSTLGTLLGTLAGYLFTRRINNSKSVEKKDD